MPKKIKLENITVVRKEHKHPCADNSRYCSECGEILLKEQMIVEYVCESCRHLVDVGDRFCSHCGVPFGDVGATEHYYKGQQITDKGFKNHLESKLGRGN